MTPAAVVLVALSVVVPSTNAYVEGDSVYVCEGGAPTRDLAWIRFSRQDVTGGPLYAFDSLYVRGMEDSTVTLAVDPKGGTHVYEQAVDTLGNASCFSTGRYLPGFVTAVADSASRLERPIRTRWFGINGLVDRPRASGIYWKVETYRDRRQRITKHVLLR